MITYGRALFHGNPCQTELERQQEEATQARREIRRLQDDLNESDGHRAALETSLKVRGRVQLSASWWLDMRVDGLMGRDDVTSTSCR